MRRIRAQRAQRQRARIPYSGDGARGVDQCVYLRRDGSGLEVVLQSTLSVRCVILCSSLL
jgi:hypothetical protein